MRTLKLAAIYFLVVFGAGFVLGVVRSLWVAPRFGDLIAELIEAPIMLVVMVSAARGLVGRTAPAASTNWAGVGGIAVVMLLLAEFGGVIRLRGLSVPEYFAGRHALATAVYFLLVAVFAVLPAIFSARQTRVQDRTSAR